jgi:hypothetical protein
MKNHRRPEKRTKQTSGQENIKPTRDPPKKSHPATNPKSKTSQTKNP